MISNINNKITEKYDGVENKYPYEFLVSTRQKTLHDLLEILSNIGQKHKSWRIRFTSFPIESDYSDISISIGWLVRFTNKKDAMRFKLTVG